MFLFTSYIGINIKPWLESRKITFPELVEYFSKLLKSLSEESRNLLIHGIINEIKFLSPTTYFYVMLTLTFLLECKIEELEENLLRNLIMRLLVKPYPAGLVWLVRDLIKNKKKYDELVKRVSRNIPGFDSTLNEVINFVSEHYKTFENYI